MNIFAFTSFSCALSCFILSVVSFVYAKAKIHRILGFFNVAVCIWGAGCFFAGIAETEEKALIGWRFGQFGGTFIAVFFYHMICIFCNLNPRKLLGGVYLWALFFSVFSIFSNFLFARTWVYHSVFYNRATPLYCALFISWSFIVLLSFSELIRFYFNTQESKKLQSRYMIFGFLIGFLGGASTLLPMFGVKILPWGNLLITGYCLIASYAILRYRLLDINVVITRTGIFIAVYSLVLGIPFALAFGFREKLVGLFGESWWMVPLVTSTVLATVGPFIYVYFQRRAEDRLFQEQRRYQATLRQASAGMGKIKDLKRLVTLIVHIMTRTVRVEYSMVFLNDVYAKKFRLGAYRSRLIRTKFRSDIDYSTALVQTLKETQNPIVYDEIKQRTQDYGDLKLARLEAELKAIDAAIVVPSFIDEKLVAILVMGNKVSGKTYSSDDLSVFSILANQSALAVENAQFYDEMKNTHAQLLKAEKMATIGTLADGLSHQINNRLHAMGFIAGDALDTLKLGHNLPMSLEVKEMILDLEHALNRIESNVQQGGEIVQGLLKYTRKDDAGVQDVALDKLIEAALDMTQFKIKPGEISISHEYPSDLPKIHGNFTQLQEVFFNLIDNAYDAMMQRKAELKETSYTPTIKIKASGGGNGHLDVIVEDNGIGIQEQDKEKIFTPFFTTKLSSKKGTGLGLYVIQRLIEENHKGKVVYESKYKQGTIVHLTLPAA